MEWKCVDSVLGGLGDGPVALCFVEQNNVPLFSKKQGEFLSS
jgi:hypothetical protein